MKYKMNVLNVNRTIECKNGARIEEVLNEVSSELPYPVFLLIINRIMNHPLRQTDFFLRT